MVCQNKWRTHGREVFDIRRCQAVGSLLGKLGYDAKNNFASVPSSTFVHEFNLKI